MNRIGIIGVLAAVLMAVIAVNFAAGKAGESATFKAGAFIADMTPLKWPVPSNGSMSARVGSSAHDPIQARCLAMSDGRETICFVVLDSCLAPREFMDAAKEKAAALCGIKTDRIAMSATHTHTGVSLTPAFQTAAASPEYIQWAIEQVAQGIARAVGRMEPAQIGWGSGRQPNQVFNRRWYFKPGKSLENAFRSTADKVKMNPGFKPELYEKPAGPIDPEVCFVAVRSTEGRPIGLLANYSLHYVGGVEPQKLSADYFAVFAERFGEVSGAKAANPDFVAIMSNGTSGDINNVNQGVPREKIAKKPYEQMRIVADDVVSAILPAWKNLQYRDEAPIAMKEAQITLGVRKPSREEIDEARQIVAQATRGKDGQLVRLHEIYANETLDIARYPDTKTIKLQAIRIGSMGICTSPCETFVEIGLAIKKQSPLKPTFTIELANGYNGYLPTPEHHQLGGYETWRAKSSYLEVDAAPKIQAKLLELLGEVAR